MTTNNLTTAVQTALNSGPPPLTIGKQSNPGAPPLEVTIVVNTRDQAEKGIRLAANLYNHTCSRHSDRIHFIIRPAGKLGEILNGRVPQ